MTITVYTLPACSQCNMTKNWLDRKGIEYRAVDLSESPDDVAAVQALGYAAAPVVIVNDNGNNQDEKHWCGFRPDLLAEFCEGRPAA